MRVNRRVAISLAAPLLLMTLNAAARAQSFAPVAESHSMETASSGLGSAAPPLALRAAVPFSAIPYSLIERTPPAKSGRKLWAASLVAVTAASLLDAHSSWGRREANGILAGSNGRFGARGVAIKAGVNAFWVVSQIQACRRIRSCNKFTAINLALASMFAATAVRNYRVPLSGGR